MEHIHAVLLLMEKNPAPVEMDFFTEVKDERFTITILLMVQKSCSS